MFRIAIIQFPGLNTEYETRREIDRAGMRGEFFRWNDDPKKLASYDGYIIGGGFSYEDRVRAGVIAAKDPIMEVLRKETDPEGTRKPLLGICNGCQILIETGLVPGAEGEKVCFSMARNKRVVDDEVLGTGYYNDWIYMKSVTPKGTTAFTRLIEKNEILTLPIAHGEGRYVTTIPGLVDRLIKNQQIIFQYCDAKGNVLPEFPINPNGSLFNIVALSNPAGNILAIMPHFERSEDAQTFLLSMKEYLELKRPMKEKVRGLSIPNISVDPKPYTLNRKHLHFFVDLIINDNEAETVQTLLQRLDFPGATVKRQTHYEIIHRERVKHFPTKLVQSGILLNTNKERAREVPGSESDAQDGSVSFLVRDKQDFIGLQKAQTLRRRLGFSKIDEVKRGTLWSVQFKTKSPKERERLLRKLLKMNLFANPHAQEVFFIDKLTIDKLTSRGPRDPLARARPVASP